MINTLQSITTDFESSSSKTPQYLACHRLFKKEFSKFLTNMGATQIEIGKPNHFDMSGFFTIANQIWYFSISDLRWSKDSMLIRMAQSYRDFTGGRNMFVPLNDGIETFTTTFHRLVSSNLVAPIG